MPSELPVSSVGANYAGWPIQVFEQECHTWTALELRTILGHHDISFRSRTPKAELMNYLRLLIKARRERGLQLTVGERDPILRGNDLHHKRKFYPRLAEVARYAVKHVSDHCNDFGDFFYVDRVLRCPLPLFRSKHEAEKKAFEEALFRYCISYRQLPASARGNDAQFAMLVKEKPIIESCTDQALEYHLRRYIHSFRRENNIPHTSNVEEESTECQGVAPHDKSSIVEPNHTLLNSPKRARLIDDTLGVGRPTKRRANSNSCPDPSISERNFDRPISPTPPQGYTTTKKICCPRCSKVYEVIKERYHKPTAFKLERIWRPQHCLSNIGVRLNAHRSLLKQQDFRTPRSSTLQRSISISIISIFLYKRL